MRHRLVKITWPGYQALGWPPWDDSSPLPYIHRAWCSCGAECDLETGRWGDWMRGHQMFPDAWPAWLAEILADSDD